MSDPHTHTITRQPDIVRQSVHFAVERIASDPRCLKGKWEDFLDVHGRQRVGEFVYDALDPTIRNYIARDWSLHGLLDLSTTYEAEPTASMMPGCYMLLAVEFDNLGNVLNSMAYVGSSGSRIARYEEHIRCIDLITTGGETKKVATRPLYKFCVDHRVRPHFILLADQLYEHTTFNIIVESVLICILGTDVRGDIHFEDQGNFAWHPRRSSPPLLARVVDQKSRKTVK